MCCVPFLPLQLILSLSPLSHLSHPSEVHVGGEGLNSETIRRSTTTLCFAIPRWHVVVYYSQETLPTLTIRQDTLLVLDVCKSQIGPPQQPLQNVGPYPTGYCCNHAMPHASEHKLHSRNDRDDPVLDGKREKNLERANHHSTLFCLSLVRPFLGQQLVAKYDARSIIVAPKPYRNGHCQKGEIVCSILTAHAMQKGMERSAIRLVTNSFYRFFFFFGEIRCGGVRWRVHVECHLRRPATVHRPDRMAVVAWLARSSRLTK